MIIIDSRMREIEKNKLKKMGYELYEIPLNPSLYNEIAGHVDIHCCKIGNYIVSNSHINIPNSIIGFSNLNKNYPLDISYNICILGKLAIHNFKYTEPKILQLIDKLNYKKIQINQGYSKCSIAVIDENSVIVTDKKISDTLTQYGINVLLLDSDINKDIHLYKNDSLEYSNMTGFIGGVISRLDNFIFVSGDLSKIDKNDNIKNFIKSRNLTIIDFPGLDIIDYGGILKY